MDIETRAPGRIRTTTEGHRRLESWLGDSYGWSARTGRPSWPGMEEAALDLRRLLDAVQVERPRQHGPPTVLHLNRWVQSGTPASRRRPARWVRPWITIFTAWAVPIEAWLVDLGDDALPPTIQTVERWRNDLDAAVDQLLDARAPRHVDERGRDLLRVAQAGARFARRRTA